MENENEKNNNKTSNRKKKKFKTYLMLFLALLICVCIGVSSSFYSFLSRLSEPAKKSDIKPKVAEKNEPVNILVMGVDIGTPGATNKNDPKRTDTIILMNYNPQTREINLVSIPRDTFIILNKKSEKINAAHAYGGVPCLIDAVEKLLDIKVNYYGKIDYNGFRQVIDAIGGINMEITRRMDYDDNLQNLHIHFKKGETVHLDGKKAEEFFRWRKNNDNTGLVDGDIGRIENQHLFIGKVVEKFRSASILPKIPSIMKVIPNYVETNMEPNDILNYGWAFTKVDKEKIKTLTLQGEAKYMHDVSYFVYDENKNKDILSILHSSEEASANKSSIKNVQLDKSNISLQVLNCTGKAGLASHYSKEILKDGYENVQTGNGKRISKSKIIVCGLDNKYDELIKSELDIKNLERMMKKEGNFDIIVMLGDDYISSK